MFFLIFLSEEKECSELPEQPSAPGDQEERSVWNTSLLVKGSHELVETVETGRVSVEQRPTEKHEAR